MASNDIDLGVISEIRLDIASSYGSGTTVRTFSNVTTNKGQSIQLVQSGTFGDSFVILVSGIYTVGYQDNFNQACNMAITLDGNPGASPFSQVNTALLAATLASAADAMMSIEGTMYMTAGTVVRAQTDGAPTGAKAFSMFKITQVG